MIDDLAKERLAEFFREIHDHPSFMDCEMVNEHTRGFQGETPLKIAVVRQDTRIVTDLLNAGADPNLPGEDDYTPLHHAAGRENSEIVRLLLTHGASTTAVDIYGHTPVDYANSSANKDIRQLLNKHAGVQ